MFNRALEIWEYNRIARVAGATQYLDLESE